MQLKPKTAFSLAHYCKYSGHLMLTFFMKSESLVIFPVHKKLLFLYALSPLLLSVKN